MAYKSRDLSVLAYANGFTLWHYTTTDSADAVDASGYFNEAADMLRAGDLIMANTATATAPGIGLLVVSANAGGVVDVADMSVIGATNSR
ncbi:hypothetical protein [Telmatospirillum sp. J64-1]|uniref:hypothetical protein n=1 Tax=Telmatospirillum sp. J64-1 TaxID=2502183 RepID=UPI00115F5C8A|nr:hypothetical protein [Telmatospirillum sp. J64-1]